MILILLCIIVPLCLAHGRLDVRDLNGNAIKIHYNVSEAETLFKEFIETFHKQYHNETEYKFRLNVFKNHLIDINRRNLRSKTEVFGITEFSDMTSQEFKSKFTGLDASLLENLEVKSEPIKLLNYAIPDQWDWRLKKMVTRVKNQAQCGACWAFSAVGVVEGQYAKLHQKLRSLSSQQMVDCFSNGNGCRGGLPHCAFQEAARVGGCMTDEDYRYTGWPGVCRFNESKVLAKVKSGYPIWGASEEYLRHLVYKYGPIAVGIYAHNKAFTNFKGGLAHPRLLGCYYYQEINHAVLIVGYGEENGEPYWIIKNSYGIEWGEQGYMRLKRGENACNIRRYAAIAEVE